MKSLDFALGVLEAFEGERLEWGITGLANELRVSKATIYRVLATFERRGYVVQNPENRNYRLGPNLRKIGQSAISNLMDLSLEAQPYMKDLRDRTEETVHLAVLDGDEAVYVAKLKGLRPVQVVSSIGDRCPAYCISTGKVLLAYASPDYVKHRVAPNLVQYTEHTHGTLESLSKELARVRENGYAVNRGEWRTELSGVAAPVQDSARRVVAAIGICGLTNSLDDERVAEIIPIVKGIGARLSTYLGAPEAGSLATQVVDSGKGG